jgi:hypothetical protein
VISGAPGQANHCIIVRHCPDANFAIEDLLKPAFGDVIAHSAG